MNTQCPACGIVHNVSFCPNCGAPAGPKMKPCKHCKSMIDIGARACPFCRRKQEIGAFAIILIIISSIAAFFVFFVFLIGLINNTNNGLGYPTTTISNSNEAKQETTSTPANIKPEELLISVGDTIKSEDMEVTINKIEFSYDILPDNTSSFYTHYEADEGSVYIHIDADVKNLSKRNLYCDEILSVRANYNDGYIYNSQTIVEDNSTGFTYAIISSIDPLKTQGIHFIISCPEEVEGSDKPLFLTIRLHGTNDIYKYLIRE